RRPARGRGRGVRPRRRARKPARPVLRGCRSGDLPAARQLPAGVHARRTDPRGDDDRGVDGCEGRSSASLGMTFSLGPTIDPGVFATQMEHVAGQWRTRLEGYGTTLGLALVGIFITIQRASLPAPYNYNELQLVVGLLPIAVGWVAATIALELG